MKFAYRDLGQQSAGSTVVVRLKGTSANVVLVDEVNFNSYRAGAPFIYAAGGHFRTSPIRLQVPRDGHWFVAVDLGGFRGRVRASVDVVPPGGAESDKRQEALVEQS